MIYQTPFLDWWHHCAHTSPYGLVWLHWYHQQDYFIYLPGRLCHGTMTWSSYDLSYRRGQILTTKSLQWTHLRPGRPFLRLGRPRVPIWVIQTHIDTIGPIQKPWFHRSHVLTWVPYGLILAHRPMEGAYNIVSFDNDVIHENMIAGTITAAPHHSRSRILLTFYHRDIFLYQSR